MTSNKKKPESNDKVKWQGYVNVYLSKEDKNHVKHNLLTDAAAIEFLLEAAENGYKFSCSYSNTGSFHTVTLYGNTAGTPNAGWAMSLRHSDFLTALSALHHVVGQDGWKSDWSERFTTVTDNDW